MEDAVKTYCVYRHTTPCGKVYIGMTMFGDNPTIRWHHGSGYIGHRDFYEAIKEYGWDNIEHEVVVSGLSQEEAESTERELIAFHKSDDPAYGYNGTSGGLSGFKTAPHVVARVVKANLGRHYISPEGRERIREWHRGRQLSEETKEKIRQKRLGQTVSPETRQKISAAISGRYIPEDVRKRAAEAKIGTRLSDEAKSKLSDAAKITRNRRKRVICIETGEIFESARSASLSLGLVKNAITSTIYQGENRTCGGFHWKYLDEGVESIMSIADDKSRASIVMPKELKDALMKVAQTENRSFGNLVVTILQNYLKSLDASSTGNSN